MPFRRMSMKEVLDLAATPRRGNEFESIEAVLRLNGGARSTHLFCFHKETPVKRRRWFDHFMFICDAWETVSEKRLMTTYGGATWWVGNA
jgi:hypothetical protein